MRPPSIASDDDLLTTVRRLTARSNITLADLLAHLGEVESLGGERHTEVLARARFRSKREILRLIAELDPKPEVALRIEPIAPAVARPLRYKVQFTASQEYVDLLEEALDLMGYKKKAASLPEVQLRALRELVQRLRKRKQGARPERVEQAAKTNAPARVAGAPSGTAPARVEEMPSGAAPARLEEASRSTALARVEEAPARCRHVPAAVRHAVWARDASRCAYVDDRGRRCAETRGLELHHRHAYALGGPATVSNLELRCKSHNALAAEEDFGREHVDWMRGKEDVERRIAGGHGRSDSAFRAD